MIEAEMFNTLVGPLLFAMFAGVWGYIYRPEKRDQLLWALTLMFVVSSGVYKLYPSLALFQLLVAYGLTLSTLLAVSFQRPALTR